MNNQKPDILEQLFQLQWLLRRRQMRHHRHFGPMGSPYQGQGRILALLKIKPEMSQKELSDILAIRPQSLGELLAKLESQGYITRAPSAADRRMVDISLTEAGKAAADEGEPAQGWDNIFDSLTPEEQTNLGDYLTRIIHSLEQRASTDGETESEGRPGFHGRGFGRGPGRHLHPGRGRSPEDFRGMGHPFHRGEPWHNPFGEEKPERPS